MTTTKIIKPKDFMECVLKAEDRGLGLDYINRQIRCPKRYAIATPDTMDSQLKSWFAKTDGQGSLFVHGKVGVGKTHSVFALAKLMLINQTKSKAYNIIEFLDMIKEQYNHTEADVKSILVVPHTLILDDFGAEKSTDWTQEIIYRLVNLRYEMMLHTIFISNLSTNELSKVYGDRITSRVIEMVGNNGIIKIAGKDRRLKS